MNATPVSWSRELPPFWLRLLPLLGLVVLVLAGVGPVRARIEEDLTIRTTAGLVDAGLAEDVSVVFVGRDATLTGLVSAASDRALAVATAAGTEGVRVVDASGMRVNGP